MQNVMRSEAEMMRMIVETAKADERIRAVYMNGSRTNLNAVRDCFQDYQCRRKAPCFRYGDIRRPLFII